MKRSNWAGWKAKHEGDVHLMTRCQANFRRHVKSKCHPNAEIRRPRVCPHCKLRRKIEAHHWDYDLPYLITWCCAACHRKIERAAIDVDDALIIDYSSVVNARKTCLAGSVDVPF